MIDRKVHHPAQIAITDTEVRSHTPVELQRSLQPESYPDIKFEIVSTAPPPPLAPIPTNRFIAEHTIHDPANADQRKRRREELESAHTVRYTGVNYYIGDNFTSMRYVLTYARAKPHQRVHIELQPELLTLKPFFDAPENVEFLPMQDRDARDEPTPALDFFGDAFPAVAVKRLLRLEGARIGRVLDEYDSGNAYAYVTLRLYGAETTFSEVIRTPLAFRAEEVPAKPTYDVVLAPGAATYPINDRRSAKSLSPKAWAEVFKAMRTFGFKGNIAFIKGNMYEEYTEEVLSAAQKAGLSIEDVPTPTLADFVQVVLQGQRFVGMDTGTTHIAAAVISAAHKHRREIDFRQLFNGKLIHFSNWKITSEGLEHGQILNYQDTKPRWLLSRRPLQYDISNLHPALVAAFMMS